MIILLRLLFFTKIGLGFLFLLPREWSIDIVSEDLILLAKKVAEYSLNAHSHYK